MNRKLTIEELRNGYTGCITSYDDNKGGLSGFKEERFIIKEGPILKVVKQLFDRKEVKEIDSPEDHKNKSFEKAEKESYEAPEKDEKEED